MGVEVALFLMSLLLIQLIVFLCMFHFLAGRDVRIQSVRHSVRWHLASLYWIL